jgi:hypothetical protein
MVTDIPEEKTVTIFMPEDHYESSLIQLFQMKVYQMKVLSVKKIQNSVLLVCERTIMSERPTFANEVNANFCS